MVLQNPQPGDDELAAIYGSNYFIGSSANDNFAPQFDTVKRATASLQLDEVAAYLGQHGKNATGLRLLEVGCGHGNMLLEARRRGYDIHGLEFSADAAQTANRKLGSEIVRVGMIGETPMPERSIDVCILVDVLEHVRDPKDFLTHVRRIVKDGGSVFIATPSVDSWSARVLGRHWMEYKREHLFYFSRDSIRSLLQTIGFTDIVISAGRKVLTPDYIIRHFEKFPIPVISPTLQLTRKVIPKALLSTPIRLTAGGINVFATR
jgi:ubiquinone/menaquinone biosynthesis C-methylase UbiE